jgi:hypothetical protein
MTTLQWNDVAFDLISGPPSTGQLAALRAAAEVVDGHIQSGKSIVNFARIGREYVVTTGAGTRETFPYNPLHEEARCS